MKKALLAPLAICCKPNFFAAANLLDCFQVQRPPFAVLLPFQVVQVQVDSDIPQILKDLVGLLCKVFIFDEHRYKPLSSRFRFVSCKRVKVCVFSPTLQCVLVDGAWLELGLGMVGAWLGPGWGLAAASLGLGWGLVGAWLEPG